MIENVDHIIIAVEDLESAEDNYTKIFGIEPVWRGFHNELGTSNVLFNFENTYLELHAPPKKPARESQLSQNWIDSLANVLLPPGSYLGRQN